MILNSWLIAKLIKIAHWLMNHFTAPKIYANNMSYGATVGASAANISFIK